MRLIKIEERKVLQMDILDAVDSFCSEQGIKYSIACGTMLGAIRHGGYIPWDDDIDIYMLREDYNRFENQFPELYKGKYALHSLSKDSKWFHTFAKIEDTRTILKEKKVKGLPIGVNIDIFIIDEVTDIPIEWKKFNHSRRIMYKKIQLASIRVSKDFSYFKNMIAIILNLVFITTNRHKLAMKMDKFIQKYNNKGFNWVFETTSGMFCKKPFPKALFNDIIDIKFEDRMYKGFKDYSTYLKSVYGDDYMTPPPPEKRTSYHTCNTFWKD